MNKIQIPMPITFKLNKSEIVIDQPKIIKKNVLTTNADSAVITFMSFRIWSTLSIFKREAKPPEKNNL